MDSKLADGIDEQVNLIPYDGGSDMPIILQGDSVFSLSDSEKAGIKKTYNAGFSIVLLDSNKQAIDALLDIIDDGHSLSSTTHPVLLAFIVRNEGHYATRLLSEPMPGDNHESKLQTATNFIVKDLSLSSNLLNSKPNLLRVPHQIQVSVRLI